MARIPSALPFLLCTLCLACPAKDTTPAPDAAPPKPAASLVNGAPGPLQRPPHPTMATAEYGQAALKSLAAASPVNLPSGAAVPAGYVKLGQATDNCEPEARDLFAASFRVAENDVTKVEAGGGVMLSLVLDPDPNGYNERLTDAYGMALTLGAAKQGGRRVEMARGVVLAAAARRGEALGAIDRTMKDAPKDAWLLLLQGITLGMLGERGDALTALDAAAALADAPVRVFYERGRLRLSVGDHAGAMADGHKATQMMETCTRCKVLTAQARALGPDPQQGLTDISLLVTSGLAPWLAADALLTAAVVEARLGHADAAATVAEKLRGLKGFSSEAAVASGLAAAAAGDHAQALLALDSGVKGLPSGRMRTLALMALARSALATGAQGRALEALRAAEKDTGMDADAAELMAQTLTAMGQKEAALDENLRAHALDPHSAPRAAAAGRKARSGGDAARDRTQRIWRLLGAKAPNQALALLAEHEKVDASDPYAAWARVVAHRDLAARLRPDEEIPPDAARAAVDAVKRAGKEPLSKVFPSEARKLLLDVLDEAPREISGASLKAFANDPDPRLAAVAKEAIARGAPRPRRSEH
ncbi:MAG: hypothetical protein AB2A00_09800 [Myxococcota bacterium]